MKYPYLLLDADNTLFDFDAGNRHAFHEVCARYDIPDTEESFQCYKRCNNAMWAAFDRGECTKVRDSSSDGYLLPADKTASVFEGAVTEVEMHNEKKPALEVPQTGDNSHMALWLGLLGISGIGAAAILLMRKHKK